MNRFWILIIIIMCWSCEEIIEVGDISDQAISVLAPTNNVVIESSSVTFSWENVIDATGYRLQIATPNFESAQQILLDSLVTETSFTNTLDFGDYQWRIRGENSVYTTAYSTINFSVNANLAPDISNELVELLSPVDNATYTSA